MHNPTWWYRSDANRPRDARRVGFVWTVLPQIGRCLWNWLPVQGFSKEVVGAGQQSFDSDCFMEYNTAMSLKECTSL